MNHDRKFLKETQSTTFASSARRAPWQSTVVWRRRMSDALLRASIVFLAGAALGLAAALPLKAGAAPYGGTPMAVPATFQAEDFDRGGEGVGYHDKTRGNAGGQYRTSEDVDIITSREGGYAVNNFETGEWLAYTIQVPVTGGYDIEIRASSAFSDSAFHIQIDGRDVTGPITVPKTSGWHSFQWVGRRGVNLTAGTRVLKVFANRQYFNLDAIRVVASRSTPYGDAPVTVPARIEAENFDRGGQGVAYHDNSRGNAGGQYRTADDVDIIASGDGGYVVNNFETGEWLNYTINVPAAGLYDIALLVSTVFTSSAFHVQVGGKDVTGTITVPNTGGWDTFQWVGKRGISLSAGEQVLRVHADRQYFNLDAIGVTAATASTPQADETPPPAAAPASAPYSGTPAALPGTIEAENFDRGGEGVAYHDKTSGNAGGQYRTSEDVDIIVSNDPQGGGYVVNNFETGEWLAYTVSVKETGLYDIELRAASTFANSGFRVEVGGRDVTGTVAVANTGGWDVFQWVGKKGVALSAGTHVLKVHATQQYFNLNSIRVNPTVTTTPYSGTPIAIPATFEAENFDRGGQGHGYYDRTPGNSGGQYRTSEDVDIVVSSDPQGGGYVVNNFETGEWLAYTITVPATGQYDIAIRAASMFSNSAFHAQLNGVNVTGSVPVPNTGSWSNFQWVTKQGVTLPAGTHQLRIVSDQQYFDLNSIRVFTPGTTSSSDAVDPSGARLVFQSGFEGGVALGALSMYSNGAWQSIAGTDSVSGHTWAPSLWGGSSRFQLIAGDSAQVTESTLREYMYNELQNVAGRNGSSTRALYSVVQKSVNGATQNSDSTQNDFILFPNGSGQGDLYISYWLRLQPDLLQRMTVNNWAGRVVTDWKTGGDYRLILSIYGDRANNRLYWHMQGDNVANGGLPQQVFWQQTNTSVPVPAGQWFRVEMFVHRSSGSDGRVWVAINGQTLFNRYGGNMGVNGLPWNRIMPFLNYSSYQQLPAYQWVDDVEIWEGLPSTASTR